LFLAASLFRFNLINTPIWGIGMRSGPCDCGGIVSTPSPRSAAARSPLSDFAKLLARAGDEAKIGFKVHPHMLRHACGYALANKGIDTRTLQAYLGHRSINSTTRYAALAPGRFRNIWGKV
jgi:integrase